MNKNQEKIEKILELMHEIEIEDLEKLVSMFCIHKLSTLNVMSAHIIYKRIINSEIEQCEQVH